MLSMEVVLMKKNVLAKSVLLTLMGLCIAMPVWAEETMKANLATVVVEGEKDTIAGGRIASVNEVGYLGNKSVMETPFHEVTLTSKVIDEFSTPGRGMIDAMTLDPSMRATTGSMDTSVSIRGFSGSGKAWNINGVPNMANQKQMAYNFADRVSVISGPAIGVAGNALPFNAQVGGSVNMISKKAGETPNASVELSWASDSYITEKIDIGERIGKNKEWGVRLTAMNANGDLAQDGANDKQRNVYVNIDRKGDHATTNLLAGYAYDNNTGLGSTISLGKLAKLPKVPKNTKALAPTWNNDTYKNGIVILNHEQKFSSKASWFVNAGYHKEDYTSWLQQWSSRTLQNLAGDYTGTYTQMPVFHKDTYVGAGFKGNFEVKGWKNDWIINVERSEFKRDRDNNVSAANKYPVTGNIYTGSPTPKPHVVWDPITHQYTTTVFGWSALDTLTSPDDKVEVTLGVHSHEVITRNGDNGASSGLRRDTDATYSPVFAVVYKPTDKISLYADHTETYNEGTVVSGAYDNDGEILRPSKTKQNEIGAKIKSGALMHNISMFEITQENVLTVPTSGPKGQARKLDGERVHRGIEYSLAGSLSKKWDAILGVSYLHAFQNKTQGGTNDGRSVSGVPRWNGDLALIYKPDDNWQIIGRLNYNGSCNIRETSSYAKPIGMSSTTLLNLGASYKTKWLGSKVTWNATCYNVFDKNYWYANGDNGIGLGAPRTFMVSAKFDF